jgi:hypothetical protein
MIWKYWSTLSEDAKAGIMAALIGCSFCVFCFGWVFLSDWKRGRQIMAMATLFSPVTILLSPVIVVGVLLYGIGKGIEWLIGTAAGEQ